MDIQQDNDNGFPKERKIPFSLERSLSNHRRVERDRYDWPDSQRHSNDQLWVDVDFLDYMDNMFQPNTHRQEDTVKDGQRTSGPRRRTDSIPEVGSWAGSIADDENHADDTSQGSGKHFDTEDTYSSPITAIHHQQMNPQVVPATDGRIRGGDFHHQPPSAGGTVRHDDFEDEVPYRTKYVIAMYSGYSIKGWGSSLPSFPCHHVHLLQEPVLLTLTSYPFLIVYANDALLHRVRSTTNIVGSAFLDCFCSDELAAKPSLLTSNIILGFLQREDGMDCKMPVGSETWETTSCLIKAHSVVSNQMGAEKVVFYAMRLRELMVQPKGGSPVLPAQPSRPKKRQRDS